MIQFFSNIINRQQTDPESMTKSFYSVLKNIINEDGPQGLWKGLRASLLLCINPAITYGLFERLKTLLQKSKGNGLNSIQIFIIGALSKTLATVVTCKPDSA